MPDIDAGARDRAMNKTDMFQWVNSSSASFDTGKLIDPWKGTETSGFVKVVGLEAKSFIISDVGEKKIFFNQIELRE